MQAVIARWAYRIALCSFCVLVSILTVPEGGAAQDTREVTIKYRGGSFTYAGSYALVVGISDYTNPDWSQLDGVKEDIKEVKKALEPHGFQVKEVLNPPNLEELENAYEDFIQQYGWGEDNKRNRLLFYFAGHAHDVSLPPGEKVAYLVAPDAPAPHDSNFRAHAMSLGKFAEMARNIDAKHVLFLFDSCFSGARGFPLGIARSDDFQRKVGKRTGRVLYARLFRRARRTSKSLTKASSVEYLLRLWKKTLWRI